MNDYKIHPIAALFPMMPDAELNELAADVKKNGLIHSIVCDGGVVIDGRNRLAACQRAGVEPTFKPFTGDDVAEYIVSANLKRRHMDASQRAMVAAKMANMVVGGKETNSANLPNCPPVSQAQAAKLMNVSPRQVTAAKAIEKASTELAEKVSKGEITVHAAKKELNPSNIIVKGREGMRAHMNKLSVERGLEPIEEDAPAATAPADKAFTDTENLESLQYTWNESSAAVRAAFLEWVKKN